LSSLRDPKFFVLRTAGYVIGAYVTARNLSAPSCSRSRITFVPARRHSTCQERRFVIVAFLPPPGSCSRQGCTRVISGISARSNILHSTTANGTSSSFLDDFSGQMMFTASSRRGVRPKWPVGPESTLAYTCLATFSFLILPNLFQPCLPENDTPRWEVSQLGRRFHNSRSDLHSSSTPTTAYSADK